jgi:hypothetical protein
LGHDQAVTTVPLERLDEATTAILDNTERR